MIGHSQRCSLSSLQSPFSTHRTRRQYLRATESDAKPSQAKPSQVKDTKSSTTGSRKRLGSIMIFLPAREGWQNFRAFKYTDVTQKQVLDALDPVPLIGFLDMTGQKDIHNFSREAAFGKHSIMAPGQLSMADGGAYLAIVPDWMRAAARPASGSIDGVQSAAVGTAGIAG